MVDISLPEVPLQRSATARPLQTLAICSGKGGVGKTNVSVNLAVAMAGLGRRVMLLDADLALANVDVLLGLRAHGHLGHVLDGELCLEDIIRTGPEGVALVPAASGLSRLARLDSAEYAGLIHAFSTLDRPLDVFIVDVAAGIGESVTIFTQAVQEVIVVVCDEPASLADAYALIKVLSTEQRLRRFQVLANMVVNGSQGQSIFTKLSSVCQRYLDVSLNYMGAVPRDDFLRKAVLKQQAVTSAYPGSPSGRAFKELAQRADNPLRAMESSGGVEFFIERMVSEQRCEPCPL